MVAITYNYFTFVIVILSYLKYFVKAKGVNFRSSKQLQKLKVDVFEKLNQINDRQIIDLIQDLKQDKTQIKITDLGAGSKQSKSNLRTVKSIVKNASIPPKFGRLLNTLVSEFKCENVLELGTSLGIGTAYLALNNKQTNIYSIEGCPKISQLAQVNVKKLKISNCYFFVGEFSSQFNSVLSQVNTLDLVYIDGNHTYEATMQYFDFFTSKLSKNAILVFDDIHWSKGMEKAWENIIGHSASKLTIDLFRMGIVLVNPDLDKEHVVLRF